ncbi:hypothetical protein ACWOBE_05470 [Hutsoniella sourekii]
MALELSQDILTSLLDHQQYLLLDQLLASDYSPSSKPRQLLQLAQAIINVDLTGQEALAESLGYSYLLQTAKLERRAYCYFHNMNGQIKRQEFADYFRGLTPMLVDVLRLVVEATFLPNLDYYLTPVIKNNSQDKPIYRGIQWDQEAIQEDGQLIERTWRRYYGLRFNYDHYLSSSHLLKLIDDHCQDQEIRHAATAMRQIEKHVRNLVAHEVVYVDREWVKDRSGHSISQIHRLLVHLMHLADLKDQGHWEILETIHAAFIEEISGILNKEK